MVIFSPTSSSVPMPPAPEGAASQFKQPELYFATTLSRGPHGVLSRALELFGEPTVTPRLAVDLGCGSGRDTSELLRRNWHVLAIDSEPAAFEHLLSRIDLTNKQFLITKACSIEVSPIPDCDLVNAGMVLPFCNPRLFPALWDRIVSGIKPAGRFCGHFFGERDSWANDPMQTHHTRAGIEALFARFEIEHFAESEDDTPEVDGEEKHWHVFEIVARKVV